MRRYFTWIKQCWAKSRIFLWFQASLLLQGCQAQIPIDKPTCMNEAFDQKVSSLLNFTVPLISVQDLAAADLDHYLILDIREKEEYDMSHIKGAQHLGYKNFEINQLDSINKNKAIIVYCSVGYRSEKIGEKLQKAGFTKVYNLYGSIFEWVNTGYDVFNSSDSPSQYIHTYNKRWAKWIQNNKYSKVW